MAGVEELAAAVRTALSKLSTASLTQAANLLEEAAQALGQTRSQQPEMTQAAGGLSTAVQGTGEIAGLVNRASGILAGYLERIGAGTPPEEGSGPAGTPTQPPAAPAPASAVPDGQRLTREQAEALQAELPPPVVANTGVRTHGRWVDEHGQAHPIASGRDEDSARAWAILQERGIPVPAETTRVSDVEQKLAARMVHEGRRHLDVALNNRPCKGPYGCDTLVPVILPEGYSMTVHAPRYRKTFTGGAKPW
ncbi:DddA-like double-stranded DNA deaminase toxin [Amycolatopsis sp. lyj-23]|uniref:DddA-like double-stranded DNA deaminase toxin n=1 Tax=Amycolatopsis sp. lyj-23 TaxID=2789283 RepID=UPI00397D8162